MVQQEPTSITPELLIHNAERFVIFQEPRFTVWGELKGGFLFLHCSPIKEWSKSCYVACLEAMNIIRSQALKYEYERVYVYIPLHRLKFISMLGFVSMQVYKDQCGLPWVLASQKTGML